MPARSRGKVLVAMSGGVDSSVAAALLQREGYEVVGVFMRLGSDDSVESGDGPDPTACDPAKIKPGHQGCCSLNDASDARLVAAMLDVPFYVMNFKQDFGRIIDYFVDEYNAGRTPNPCIRCNTWLKFGKLADYARSIDADWIATGHYARVDHSGPTPRLLRGVSHAKDQSYVLFGARPTMLERMLLPVGEYEKPAIRALAESLGLPVFDKPDSQEICFVPDNDYMGLVRRRTPDAVAAGTIVDREGNVLGEHGGQQQFTVGQRRGLNVAAGVPLYVLSKDPASNTVTVGGADELFAVGLKAEQANWFIAPPTDAPLACEVKIRSNSAPTPGTVLAIEDGRLEVAFDEPQRAVSPGQAVVCYLGEQVIGGGWITRAMSR